MFFSCQISHSINMKRLSTNITFIISRSRSFAIIDNLYFFIWI
nr:MAG TPA: hypothetical protein [Caudoviricetes sp.]